MLSFISFTFTCKIYENKMRHDVEKAANLLQSNCNTAVCQRKDGKIKFPRKRNKKNLSEDR